MKNTLNILFLAWKDLETLEGLMTYRTNMSILRGPDTEMPVSISKKLP